MVADSQIDDRHFGRTPLTLHMVIEDRKGQREVEFTCDIPFVRSNVLIEKGWNLGM